MTPNELLILAADRIEFETGWWDGSNPLASEECPILAISKLSTHLPLSEEEQLELEEHAKQLLRDYLNIEDIAKWNDHAGSMVEVVTAMREAAAVYEG